MSLKRWLSNCRGIPEFAVVGLKEPQEHIRVELHGFGEPQDITFDHSIVAMRPLTISIASRGHQKIERVRSAGLSLEFIDTLEGQRRIGRVGMKYVRTIELPRARLDLFHATGSWNGCLPWATLRLFYIRRAYLKWRSRSPFNFEMSRDDRCCLSVLYICPRPVVLVSVVDSHRNNIFPMDLIGAVGQDYFLMALRTTSNAVELMEHSRQMALSSIPADHGDIAYRLGVHHRKDRIDLAGLPFETTESPRYGLPVPKSSLAVREVHVEETHTIGSHRLFVTTTANRQPLSDAPRMFHIHGTYYQYLRFRERLRCDSANALRS